MGQLWWAPSVDIAPSDSDQRGKKVERIDNKKITSKKRELLSLVKP